MAKTNDNMPEYPLQNGIYTALIALLRRFACGDKNAVMPENVNIQELYTLAKKHDLAHFVGFLPVAAEDPVKEIAKREQFLALWRYEQQNYALNQIRILLETEKICFMPLKGSVIRGLYPEPWLRTSSDIDILVRKADLDQVTELFENRLGFRKNSSYEKDISFSAPGRVHIELHHMLFEKNSYPDIEKVLDRIWEAALSVNGSNCEKQMPDAYFYFYHVAHMRKHLLYAGGCGVRSVLDLWLMNQDPAADCEKRKELLILGGILEFEQMVSRLADSWFTAGMEMQMDELANVIITGGTFGSHDRKILLGKNKHKNRLKYAVIRLFPAKEIMSIRYPFLGRFPCMLPLCWMHRWIAKIPCAFRQGRKELHEEAIKEEEQYLLKLQKERQ